MPARNALLQLVPPRVRSVANRLRDRVWTQRRAVDVLGGPVNADPIPLDEARAQPMEAVRPGEYFGPGSGDPDPWQQRWFRVEVPAPAEGEAGRRFLQWDCRGEHTVYVDGVPWSGLDVAHTSCPLPDRACTLWIECGTYQTCIWWEGKPIEPHGLRFDGAWTALRDQAAWDLYWDFAVLADLLARLLKRHGSRGDHESRSAAVLGSADPLLRRLLVELNDACDALDAEGPEALAERLRHTYEQLPSEPWQPAATLIGSSHLDLVWMWGESVGETKGIHTAATMLRLLERYPEFRFMWTQPALYRALERREPALFEQIRAHVAAGRWEVTGAMWVEAENNVPCGEALARCLVLGQRAIERLRGEPGRCVWLPDCFGFSASLPQLMRLAGVEVLLHHQDVLVGREPLPLRQLRLARARTAARWPPTSVAPGAAATTASTAWPTGPSVTARWACTARYWRPRARATAAGARSRASSSECDALRTWPTCRARAGAAWRSSSAGSTRCAAVCPSTRASFTWSTTAASTPRRASSSAATAPPSVRCRRWRPCVSPRAPGRSRRRRGSASASPSSTTPCRAAPSASSTSR